jgi:WD40 repeat protein
MNFGVTAKFEWTWNNTQKLAPRLLGWKGANEELPAFALDPESESPRCRTSHDIFRLCYRRSLNFPEGAGMFLLSLSLFCSLPQPELRLDNYGDALPPGAVARLGTLRYRPPHNSQMLGFTADAKAVVFQKARELVFMDAATGKATTRSLAKLLDAKTPGARLRYGCVLSGNGATLLLLTNDRRIIVLDMVQDKVIREFSVGDFVPLPQGDDWPVGFKLAHDGKTLMVLDFSQPGSYRLRWVSAAIGEVCRETAWNKGQCHRGLWFLSPGGEFVGIPVKVGPQGQDTVLEVWETASAKPVTRQLVSEDSEVVTLGADGKTAILRKRDHCALVEFGNGNPLAKFSLSWPEFAVVQSPDGKSTFVSNVGALEQWDTKTGKKLRIIPHFGQIQDYWGRPFLSHDGQRVAMEVGDVVTIYDVAQGKALHHGEGHGDAVGALAWSPSGQELLTVAKDDRALWWDAGAAKKLRDLAPPSEKPQPARTDESRRLADVVAWVFPNGQHLAASWPGYPLFVWDAAGKKVNLPELDDVYAGVAVSAVKSLIAFADAAGNVVLFDLALGKLRTLTMTKPPDFVGQGTFRLLCFSTDGRYLAGSGVVDPQNRVFRHDHVVVWELATGKQVAHLQILLRPDGDQLSGVGVNFDARAVRGLYFSPQGRHLAVAFANSIFVFDLATGREEKCFAGQRILAHTAAFNRTGTLLAAGTRDGTVRLWDVKTGKLIGDVPGHGGAVTTLAFSPDGTRLASGSADTTVLIWDVAELTRLASAPESLADLETLWQQLGDADPGVARKAMTALAQHAGAVAFMQAHLQTVPPADAKTLAALIDDLDHPQFARRDAAMVDLVKLAGHARSALEARLKTKPSLEMRKRLIAILERLDAPITDGGHLRTVRGIEVLEWIATPGARQLLERLAMGAPGHRFTEDAKAALARSK